MKIKESQIILEKILDKSDFPRDKLEEALHTIWYLDWKNFRKKLDKATAEASKIYNLNNSTNDYWNPQIESENIFDKLYHTKQKRKEKRMPQNIRKEVERLMPKYKKYTNALFIESIKEAERKMHERYDIEQKNK